MASKIKLFNKLGVGRRHKSVDAEPPKAVVISKVEQHIEDCVEYSLPPDCESDDGVYCEPADSLNTGSISSNQSYIALAKETSDSDQNTLPRSLSSVDSAASMTRQLDISYSPNTNTEQAPSTTQLRSSPNTLTSAAERDMNTPVAMPVVVSDFYNGQDSSVDNPSAGLYMNEAQIQAAKACHASGSHITIPTPKITPDVDPRNAGFPASGNEYESPWDLESEIIEVVKQIKSPSSSVASLSTQTLHNPQSLAVSEQHQLSAVYTTNSLKGQRHTDQRVPGAKINYDVKNVPLHKVRQPNAQRQATNPPVRQNNAVTPGVSSVLVEGEWREAKSSLPVASPSSPELSSPAQILSQSHSQSSVGRSGTNAATNFIYDNSNASEIKAMFRPCEDKVKVPCAQPRASLSTSPSNLDEDQVYENFTDPKKAAARNYDTDGVYDDPWNVEQVQQQIFDQLGRQTQKPLGTSESKHVRGHDHSTHERSKKAEVFSTPSVHKRRPTDLPSESGSFRSGETGTRMLLSSSSTTPVSDKTDKLSPRALPGSGSSIHVKQAGGGPHTVPNQLPGQTHANKPVLVVHKTNGALINSHERKGSISSSRSGSMRKTPSTPGDVPECQHRLGISVNKNVSITQQPWYHGAIPRHYAEDLLRRQPDGSFLIRESSNSPRDKTLSLKNSSGFIHIKITQQPDGTVVLGQFSHPFKNIMEMVEYYSRHKVNIKGAEHTYLEIPVIADP